VEGWKRGKGEDNERRRVTDRGRKGRR